MNTLKIIIIKNYLYFFTNRYISKIVKIQIKMNIFKCDNTTQYIN